MNNPEFVERVFALQPRIVAFDCDGTLWDADSGEQFFYWEMERGLVPAEVESRMRQRYYEYRSGRVGEEEICGEMVTMHAGIETSRIEAAAEEFYATRIEPRIFPAMRDLVQRLAASGCEIWAVSSTNEWVVKSGVKHFGIVPERVLAACVECVDGHATGRLRAVPSGAGKVVALKAALKGPLDAAFGNAIHDVEMLKMARQAFAVNPNPDLEKEAKQYGWTIYRPAR